MVDFRYRISSTVEHYARSLKALGRTDQVEVVVVDWGSEIPLSKSLRLGPEACRISRFLYVPSNTIAATQGGRDYFNIARACNVALRHAKGKFLFVTNADPLMPRSGLEMFLRVLSGEVDVPVDIERTFMVVPRLQVPWQFIQREPSLEEWDRYLFFNEYTLPREPITPQSYLFGSSAGFAFSRKMNDLVGGLNENQPGWGWNDMEFGFRAVQEGSYVYLSNLGVQMFHMEHPPGAGSRSERPILTNLIWPTQSRANPENWGLHREPIEEQKAQAASAWAEDGTTAPGLRIEGMGEEMQIGAVSGIESQEVLSHVARVMKQLHSKDWERRTEMLGALCFLTWYAMSRFPHRCLEVGLEGSDADGVVVAACPNVQVCEFETMTGDFPGQHLPAFLKDLKDLGLCGHFHLLNGTMQSLTVRLDAVRDTFADFDLIHVRAERLAALGREGISALLEHLSPKGALVLSRCDRPLDDLEVAMVLTGGFRVYISGDGKAVLLLADGDPTASGSREITRVFAFDLTSRYRLAGAGRPLSPGRLFARSVWHGLKRLRDSFGDD